MSKKTYGNPKFPQTFYVNSHGSNLISAKTDYELELEKIVLKIKSTNSMEECVDLLKAIL